MTPGSMKAAAIKPATQVLDELCVLEELCVCCVCVVLDVNPVLEEFWRSCVLHSAIGPDQRQLFLYKISIPQYPHLHPFTPAKLCTVVEEAKVHAAEHTLQTLCLQTEGSDAAGASAIASVAFPGYALASPAAALKQAVSLGQDLTAYATYEGFPAFAVATRHSDGYGVF
ncbi:hypothetical protein KUCAC02_035506 [Chaenocephalus aceratus]|nr:hypothetical protein KUCAC02_035506 [Chaenocephalus aceratus]